MSKNYFLTLGIVVICALIATKVYADTTTINGNASLKDTAFESLTINGSLDFKNLDIKKDLKVNGSLDGNNLKCAKLKANGSVTVKNIKVKSAKINGSLSGSDVYVKHDLEIEGAVNMVDITVTGKTKVIGGLSVTKGDFGDIEVVNTTTYLSHCKGKNILVKKIDSDKIQKLELSKGTIISGDVVFESGEGEVHLSNDSIIKGNVKGAKIIKSK